MAAKRPSIATKLALMWARRQARKHPPAAFSPLAPDSHARILVVNTTGIGDTIFATAPIADLRESFPNAYIAAFVDRRRLELLAGNPRLNSVIPYAGKFRAVRATREKLRGFDVAIIQHANDPDVVPLVASAQPKALVGYASHTFSLLYSIKLPPADRAGGAHTLDARLALTRAAGAAGTHWHTELYPSSEHHALAQKALAAAGFEPGQAIALNIGGSQASKRWPAEHWSALLQLLSRRGMQAVILGGPAESADARRLLAPYWDKGRSASLFGSPTRALAGSLPFMASAALLKLCGAHISGDTGLMQAGLALDVPTVALFGPDDPAWTGPYPRQLRTVVLGGGTQAKDRRKEDQRLMGAITPQAVLAALDALIPGSKP